MLTSEDSSEAVFLLVGSYDYENTCMLAVYEMYETCQKHLAEGERNGLIWGPTPSVSREA